MKAHCDKIYKKRDSKQDLSHKLKKTTCGGKKQTTPRGQERVALERDKKGSPPRQ